MDEAQNNALNKLLGDLFPAGERRDPEDLGKVIGKDTGGKGTGGKDKHTAKFEKAVAELNTALRGFYDKGLAKGIKNAPLIQVDLENRKIVYEKEGNRMVFDPREVAILGALSDKLDHMAKVMIMEQTLDNFKKALGLDKED